MGPLERLGGFTFTEDEQLRRELEREPARHPRGVTVGRVAIGVDIGKKVDPTAAAVVEAQERADPQTGAMADHYLVRHIERLELGTPYPGVAQRLSAIVAQVHVKMQTAPEDRLMPTIWLDATGVGQPIVDLLAEAGLPVTACYFTHGDRLTENSQAGTVSLGKALLVSRLQVLLQSRRVHLPRTAEAETLARELLDYEIHVDEHANDRYGAFRVGSHDDMVTSLGLAVLAAERAAPAGVWFAR
jgi:hypothetical protein